MNNGVRIASKWLPWIVAVIFAAGGSVAMWHSHIGDDSLHPRAARVEDVAQNVDRMWRVLCKIADANQIESADCPP